MEPTANSVRSKNLLFLALAFFFLSISLEAQTDFEYYNIALVKFNIGDYKGAESDLTKAIEINPEMESAYHNRGYARFMSGDINGACLDWHKAYELGYAEASVLIKEHCSDNLHENH